MNLLDQRCRASRSIVAGCLLVLAGCRHPSVTTPKLTLFPLPSGKSVHLLRIYKTGLRDSQEKVLVFKYLTKADISDSTQLTKEFADVWGAFRPIAQSKDCTIAVISATEYAWIDGRGNRGATCLYRQAADGSWRLAANGDKTIYSVLGKQIFSGVPH